MLYKKLLAAMLTALAVTGSYASNEWNDSVVGYVAATPDGVVFAYKLPCPEHLAARFPSEARASLHAAKMVKQTTLQGCWAADNQNIAYFGWENGTYGWLFQNSFRLLRAT
jgi:hypothetical protein